MVYNDDNNIDIMSRLCCVFGQGWNCRGCGGSTPVAITDAYFE